MDYGQTAVGTTLKRSELMVQNAVTLMCSLSGRRNVARARAMFVATIGKSFSLEAVKCCDAPQLEFVTEKGLAFLAGRQARKSISWSCMASSKGCSDVLRKNRVHVLASCSIFSQLGTLI